MTQKMNAPAATNVAMLPITIPAIAPAPIESFFFCSAMIVGVAIISGVEVTGLEEVVEAEVVDGMLSEPPSLPVTLSATVTLKPDAAAHPYPIEFPAYSYVAQYGNVDPLAVKLVSSCFP